MASGAAKLIQKEYTTLCKNPSRYLQVYDVEDMFKWTVFIIAPDGTPYEKGIFRALIRFPDSYPMDPPSVQFVSDIVHPNIYRDGKVCMSTIQNPAPAHLQQADHDPLLNWRPVLGIEQVIVSLVSMLADPNCDDPANRDCAKLFMQDHDTYLEKAKACAKKSLQEIPEDFIVIPPNENEHVTQQADNTTVDMMEMSWQGSDDSDEGIVEFSDGSDVDDSDNEDDDESQVNTQPRPDSCSRSSQLGANGEGPVEQAKDLSDAEVAAQLQAELDRSK